MKKFEKLHQQYFPKKNEEEAAETYGQELWMLNMSNDEWKIQTERGQEIAELPEKVSKWKIQREDFWYEMAPK